MDEPRVTTSPTSRLVGRASWLLQSPLYRHGARIRARQVALSRIVFMLRVRAAALMARSQVHLELSPGADISAAVHVEVWPHTVTTVRIGPDARIKRDVFLSLRGGELTVGSDSEIRRLCTVQVGGELWIGSGATLSTGVIVHCAESIFIDDLTIIGEFSTITDSAHLRTPPGEPIHHSVRSKPVRIGSNVWIGAHAIIASGVVIGDQAFIGGGAIVLRDAPAGWLTAGNPAKPVREIADVGTPPAPEA